MSSVLKKADKLNLSLSLQTICPDLIAMSEDETIDYLWTTSTRLTVAFGVWYDGKIV